MKEEITFKNFNKIDIRIGTIIAVNDFPEAHKPAYQLTVDFCMLGIKKSSAQITHLYKKEALINSKITAIVNFKKKQIANFFSECLVLGIDNRNKQVVLLQASNSTVINGKQVS